MSKDGMKVLTIYQFQAEHIEDTFRKVSNLLHSTTKETCLDRDVIQAWDMIKNCIADKKDESTVKSRYR